MYVRDTVPTVDPPDRDLLASRLSSLCRAMGAWRLAVARRLALSDARSEPFAVLAAVEGDDPRDPPETALPLAGYRQLIDGGRGLRARVADSTPLGRWLRIHVGSELRGWALPNDRLPCVYFLAAFRADRVPGEGRLRVAEQGMEALARALTPPQWLMGARVRPAPTAAATPRPADRELVQRPNERPRGARRRGTRRDAADSAAYPAYPAATGAEGSGVAAATATTPLVLLGTSSVVQELTARARRVAATDAHALLCGERGTGREDLARWIHLQSARAGGPFHSLPCVALPGARLLHALLGRGRAGGATASGQRPGLLELACSGTLFLEEVGELPRDAQAALLQALRQRELLRPGDKTRRRIDVRILASTRHDLHELSQRGRFLEELYWLLAGATIPVPALRARPDDLPGLLRALAQRVTGDDAVFARLEPEALALVRRGAWVGNLLQLAAEVERMLSQFGRVPEVKSAMLSESIREEAEVGGVHELHQLLPLERAYDVVEALMIRRALRCTEGNKSAAARALGLSRQGLYKKLRAHGLEARQDAEPSL